MTTTSGIYRGSPLSRRELQIMILIANGHTRVSAAAQLHLSGNTMHSHLDRIFHKLGTSTQAQTVAVLMAAGRITPADITRTDKA